MSNTEKAAQVIYDALSGKYGDFRFPTDAAEALADAELLAADLPEPDLDHRDPAHRTKYQELWDGPVPDVWREGLPDDLAVLTLPGGSEVHMNEDGEPMEPFSPEEARRLAHALLAAANHAVRNQE